MTTRPCVAGLIASTRVRNVRPTTSATPPTASPTRRPPKLKGSLMSRVPAHTAPAWAGKPIGPVDFGVERFTVSAVLDRRAEEFPDRVMMSIAGTQVTFEQMRRRSCAAADALLDLGIGPG